MKIIRYSYLSFFGIDAMETYKDGVPVCTICKNMKEKLIEDRFLSKIDLVYDFDKCRTIGEYMSLIYDINEESAKYNIFISDH